jgi:gentisate 1,2-dioxygenase
VEGSGTFRSAGQTFEWRQHDTFVIPSWNSFDLECATEAVLFSFSDRIVQEKLDFFREQRANV